jgi:hypothetical protein
MGPLLGRALGNASFIAVCAQSPIAIHAEERASASLWASMRLSCVSILQLASVTSKRECPLYATATSSREGKVIPDWIATYEVDASPKLPAPDFSTPLQTGAMFSVMSARALAPVDKQSSLVQPGDQLPSRPSELEKVTVPVPESSKPVRAAAKVATSAASFNGEEPSRLPLRDITASLAPEAVDRLNPPSTLTVLDSTTARTFVSLRVAKIQRDLEAQTRTPVTESQETLFPSPNRKRKPSEPHTLCAVKSAMLSPSESPTPAPYRRPRTRRSAPHLGKSPGNKRQVKIQTPEGSTKRRRMRTASALGMENVTVAVKAATMAVDRNGQIVLPAGTGWKGRSWTASQLPVAQRQRQTTLPTGAAT